MHLTLPAGDWARIDADCTDPVLAERDERVLQGRRPQGRGVWPGAWVCRFIERHHCCLIVWPTDPLWTWHHGEGSFGYIDGKGPYEPPGGRMVCRSIGLRPDRPPAQLLAHRATHEGRPAAEVLRRLIRQHWGTVPPGRRSSGYLVTDVTANQHGSEWRHIEKLFCESCLRI